MAPPQSLRWCFTLNNFTPDERDALVALIQTDAVKYGVLGYETGESGTPHIQGFVIFGTRKRLTSAKQLLGQRCHLEVARGTSEQAATYCKKDGDYVEHGDLPGPEQGKRNDWAELRDYIKQAATRPTLGELWEQFPSLVGRYRSSVVHAIDELYQPPAREIGQLRDWQRELERELDGEPDDRSIRFVIDPEGNSGKTWFIKYYMFKHPGTCQMMSVGKRDDLAHSLRTSCRVIFLNIPRGCMEYLQYSFLESVKDGIIFSPKYESATKQMEQQAHVVVMCNELPDYNKLSRDRFKETLLGDLNQPENLNNRV